MGWGSYDSLMIESYTIGQLAQKAGVPTSTLRYYERIGLLKPTERTAGNYRAYGGEAVDRLLFIVAAHKTGLTLKDIATLLELRDKPASTCGELQELLTARIEDVEGRMLDFERVLGTLREMLVVCRTVCPEAEEAGHCEVIAGLDHKGTGSRGEKTEKSVLF